MITELEAIKIELGNSRPMQSIEKKEDNSNQMDQLGSPSSKSSNEDIVINTVPSNYTFIDLCD